MSATKIFDDLVEIPQIAARFHKHERTVHRWMNEPDGLPYIKLGNKRYVIPATMREWLLRRMKNPAGSNKDSTHESY